MPNTSIMKNNMQPMTQNSTGVIFNQSNQSYGLPHPPQINNPPQMQISNAPSVKPSIETSVVNIHLSSTNPVIQSNYQPVSYLESQNQLLQKPLQTQSI